MGFEESSSSKLITCQSYECVSLTWIFEGLVWLLAQACSSGRLCDASAEFSPSSAWGLLSNSRSRPRSLSNQQFCLTLSNQGLPWARFHLSEQTPRLSFLSWAWTCPVLQLCRVNTGLLVEPSCCPQSCSAHLAQPLAQRAVSIVLFPTCAAVSPTPQSPRLAEPLGSAASWCSCGEAKTSMQVQKRKAIFLDFFSPCTYENLCVVEVHFP